LFRKEHYVYKTFLFKHPKKVIQNFEKHFMFHIQNLYLFFIASLLLNLTPENDMMLPILN